MPTTAAQLSSAPLTDVSGLWQRHLPANLSHKALQGRRSTARWGTRDGFPVLYLGAPEQSVVLEAYRHLVDPLETPLTPGSFIPRMLVTARVEVTNILDLRTATGRAAAGLTIGDLQTPVADREGYRRCQLVAQLAHQLGYYGIVTPAATEVGETLALFTDLLPEAQRPVQIHDQLWDTMPDDPRIPTTRHLRVVRPPEVH